MKHKMLDKKDMYLLNLCNINNILLVHNHHLIIQQILQIEKQN